MRKSTSAFRKLAIQMGGVLIKIGQFLSTRVDILPPEVTSELSGLQDEVPPVPVAEIRKVAEEAYGAPLEEIFSEFDPVPLAAASLGQVHKAWLRDPLSNGLTSTQPNEDYQYRSKDVVVKILRPNIEQVIQTDMAAVERAGRWIQRYKPIRKRADVLALIQEFRQTLYEEIDYLAEGRNAETFMTNFQEIPGIRVPHVLWSQTTRQTLVLENVLGIKITDYDEITRAGISRPEVASRLLDTYLKQIFEDGFFHADPHPGNLFVDPGRTPNSWKLTFVDFGMVGRITPKTKQGLRQLLIGIGTQDAGMVVEAYQTLGVLLPNADLELIEKAEARIFDQFWGKSMSEMAQVRQEEIREFGREFRELINTFPFQFPQNLLYVVRVVGILSGICTGLDPDFNLWVHLAPYARKLMLDEQNGRSNVWFDQAASLFRVLLALPSKVDRVLTRMDRGEIRIHAPEINRRIASIESGQKQLMWGILFTGLLLGGINLAVAGWYIPAGILLVGALVAIIQTFRVNNRNGS